MQIPCLPFRILSDHHHTEKIAELEGLKALVADDDFNTCDSVTKMLVKVGMRSEWTLSGREAVLRARQSVEAKAAGVTAFCAKPLFMSDIRETLMSAISQSQSESEDLVRPEAGSDFRGRCILLVEDNELNSEIALDDPVLAGITILAMTANAFDEDRKKALECGMDGFLSNPIVIEDLISILHDNLQD